MTTPSPGAPRITRPASGTPPTAPTPPSAPRGKTNAKKPPVRAAAPTPQQPEVAVRRTRRYPFIPPSGEDQSPAVSRELISRGRIGQPQLSRNRKMQVTCPSGISCHLGK